VVVILRQHEPRLVYTGLGEPYPWNNKGCKDLGDRLEDRRVPNPSRRESGDRLEDRLEDTRVPNP